MKSVPGIFVLGLSLGAMLLRVLVGLSESPLTGVVITAAFGAGTVALGASAKQKQSAAAETTQERLRLFGLCLTVFAIVFSVGLSGGIAVKLRYHRDVAALIPWDAKSKPASAYDAIHWMITSRELLLYGYSPDQVREVYQLSKPNNNSSNDVSIFDRSHDSISELFSKRQSAEKPKPGPVAWDPLLSPRPTTG